LSKQRAAEERTGEIEKRRITNRLARVRTRVETTVAIALQRRENRCCIRK